MQFIFFDRADNILFVRDDAESGTWTQEEMSLVVTFPFDPAKEITQGIRVGFTDELGIFQVFEVRKVRSYEPDHYQEITAENIVVSELTDEFYNGGEIDDKTPAQALGLLLTGTLWSVGNVTATNVSSCTTNRGDVWLNSRVIETNWNVLITPRITVGATGITGRYLDIAPNTGVWRGLRLSLEKNADEVGVTIDDSDVFTAMYGFGHSVDSGSSSTEPTPLTFADVVWEATASHPAKPSGQTYLEDPTATALYGRNGRARFTFYQNADITDPNILLQKTWESLQTCNAPKVTIDCLVRDLYRLGYADQPLRLHDKVIVELREINKVYTLDITRLSVNLLDPTATRVTIGAYIPNIIYIQRDTADKARGGGGGGGRGQTKSQYERQEFETEIAWNKYQITLKASQNDLNDLTSDVRLAEASITVMANQIQSKVSAGDIASTINQTAQSVLIQASKIDLEGYVTATELATDGAYIASVTADSVDVAGGDVTINSGGISCSNLDVNGTDLSGIGSTVSAVRITQGATADEYKLQYQTYDSSSWTDAGTFSRAATATIEGTWSSGTFTVSATSGTTNTVTTTIGMTAGGQGTDFSVSAYADGDITKKVGTQNLVLVNGTSASQVYAGNSSTGTLVASLSYPFSKTTITPVTGQPLTLKSAAYYTGGGGSFTVQGSTGPKLYHRGQVQLYILDNGTYKPIGNGSTDWYYVSSIGTQYYNAGTQTKYDRGGSVPVYVSDASGTAYYQAGTAVTVYTKN